jgi:hypothetical protein
MNSLDIVNSALRRLISLQGRLTDRSVYSQAAAQTLFCMHCLTNWSFDSGTLHRLVCTIGTGTLVDTGRWQA